MQSTVFVLLASVCLIQVQGLGFNSEPNDYTWGAKVTGDTLIASEVVVRNKAPLQTVTRTYVLTQAGTAKIISYIRIRDLKKMRGATAEITAGGVGSDTVTIRFTSARSAGIKSQVEIWGQ
ncbi:uncharacterized protein LOC115630948 [Scaptodrosophila lebanonensis]|uniref:Uncharacterized protein LOC115630948 n=1 Tax=Drosophila lebanonensis TaxID=7225 RepID=A0A6J2U7A3_DROLE|nr:uncharacterized protein LOC115630948 [Scaptodrosophila lebanonensis]